MLADEAATRALAARLARAVQHAGRDARLLLALRGDLGAGKSTLARALLRALGVRGVVRSPTYTLVEPYELDDGTCIAHLDLYRLADAGELDFIGYRDERERCRLVIVEWPERVPRVLDEADLVLELVPGTTPVERQLRVRAGSTAGQALAGAALGAGAAGGGDASNDG